MSAPDITVVGSVNLDLMVTCERLPVAGETVLGGAFAAHPGGKGANQALAAQRLGARVAMIARTGADAEAGRALACLRASGVNMSACRSTDGVATGIAQIAVDRTGANQIVVAPGANALLSLEDLPATIPGGLIAQLEVPVETVAAATARCEGFVALNLAPATSLDDHTLARADLIVVNETEAAFYGKTQLKARSGMLAITLGAQGAVLFRNGEEISRAAPPRVRVVDTTGAGDCFMAALTLGLLEGQSEGEALRFACAAGAAATQRAGAQPALPDRRTVDALLDVF